MKKTEMVRSLVKEGEYRKALRIAKDFRLGISKEDSDAMKLGYECIVHPGFYIQLGYNVNETVKKGIQALTRLYG